MHRHHHEEGAEQGVGGDGEHGRSSAGHAGRQRARELAGLHHQLARTKAEPLGEGVEAAEAADLPIAVGRERVDQLAHVRRAASGEQPGEAGDRRRDQHAGADHGDRRRHADPEAPLHRAEHGVHDEREQRAEQYAERDRQHHVRDRPRS